MVSLIMILMRHPMDEKLYKEICSHAGDLVMAYEMYMTFYEKSGYLAIRFSSFSTPIIALSAEKSEDAAQRKMPCRHSSNVTPFPAKQAFTTKSPQRKR